MACILHIYSYILVINHLDKLFVTNDAGTIVTELEVQHPAAKLLVLAGKAQQEEIGDGADLTISFAGELPQNAEELIRMGLHLSEIISGYIKAIAKACIQVCPKNPMNFNVDNVRVAKLSGGGLHNCTIVRGMVLKGDSTGSIKRIEKAKEARNKNIEHVLILSGDHFYRMDYMDFVQNQVDRNADITVSSVPVD